TPIVAHAATFALPANVADFGGGAVERMRRRDVFLSLVEYGPESVGTPLFSRQGVPRALAARDFQPDALQRPLPGQGGTQVFFTDQGRASCLYVVLGSYQQRTRLLPVLDGPLAGITIG